MAGGAENIVSFQSPPVVEVVAGVALSGAGADANVMLGAFWKDRLRTEFPTLQPQPTYTPPVEVFGPGPHGPTLTFEFGLAPPTARLWAMSPDGQNLLQLQPDYFACNWRKVQPHDQYDRWSKRRHAFTRWLTDLLDYLAAEGAPRPGIHQCEVTYINHIVAGKTWQSHADFSRVFRVGLQSFPHPLEQVAAQAQFVLGNDGQPWGRLHARIMPAFARDGRTPLFVLELTARGAPMGDDVEGATNFLDRARDAIDRTFLALTTEEMQTEWGIER